MNISELWKLYETDKRNLGFMMLVSELFRFAYGETYLTAKVLDIGR
ncbi:hypothetical protein [Paenibacillus hemerocallicola]|nr:hypothetical protein [Paenibacillus hemerocallicola]